MSDKPNCEIARRERDAAQSENAKLRRVLKAAVELVCSTGWAGVSDEDVVLERTLRECGFVAPNPVVRGATESRTSPPPCSAGDQT